MVFFPYNLLRCFPSPDNQPDQVVGRTFVPIYIIANGVFQFFENEHKIAIFVGHQICFLAFFPNNFLKNLKKIKQKKYHSLMVQLRTNPIFRGRLLALFAPQKVFHRVKVELESQFSKMTICPEQKLSFPQTTPTTFHFLQV